MHKRVHVYGTLLGTSTDHSDIVLKLGVDHVQSLKVPVLLSVMVGIIEKLPPGNELRGHNDVGSSFWVTECKPQKIKITKSKSHDFNQFECITSLTQLAVGLIGQHQCNFTYSDMSAH
ncbi:hypothetical protein BgiMline_008633 [Biomphalaria glabrata]|nr:hypothetical protein BgiBS90_033793 [Biomphalaria glabrata]